MYRERTTRRTLTMLLTVLMVLGGVFVFQMSQGLTVDAASSLVNQSTVSSDNINKGQKVTVNGVASGGSGGYEYAYFFRRASMTNWITGKSYSTLTSYTLKPSVAEDYCLLVKVRDKSGKVAKKSFTVKVNPVLESKASVSAATITKGMSLKVYGAAEGGSGSYQFAYYYRRSSASSWTTVKSYSKTRVVTIKPAAAVSYDVMVKTKDTNGSVVKSTFTVSVDPALVSKPSLSGTTFKPGEQILVSTVASGGSGTYQYAFSYRSVTDSTWISLIPYDRYTGIYFMVEDTGDYEVLIKVKDSNGAGVSSKLSFTIDDDELNEMVDAVLGSIILDDMDDFGKAKEIHDWLVNNVRYDYENLLAGTIPESSFTAKGLMQTGLAVCDGYAKAFVILCQRAGLEATRVAGTADDGTGSQSHAWNQVKVDGKWYNVDVTWDDPVMQDGSEVCNYNYFLIPDSVMDRDHTAETVKKVCDTPQPTERILEAMLKDTSAEMKYSICETEEDLAPAMQNFADQDILDFYLICHLGNDMQAVLNQVGAHLPDLHGYEYSVHWSIQNFGLEGYTVVHIQIDKITGYC